MAEPKDPISEIEQLIDELESYAEKTPWWQLNKIVIRDEDFFRIIARIRELMPAELAEAKSMLSKRDLILKNAQEEHRRILSSAERRLEDLTSEEHVVVAAQQQAGIDHPECQAGSGCSEAGCSAVYHRAPGRHGTAVQADSGLDPERPGFLESEIGQQIEDNLAGTGEYAGKAEPAAVMPPEGEVHE